MRRTNLHEYSSEQVAICHHTEVIAVGILVGTYIDKHSITGNKLVALLNCGRPFCLHKFYMQLTTDFNYSPKEGSIVWLKPGIKPNEPIKE